MGELRKGFEENFDEREREERSRRGDEGEDCVSEGLCGAEFVRCVFEEGSEDRVIRELRLEVRVAAVDDTAVIGDRGLVFFFVRIVIHRRPNAIIEVLGKKNFSMKVRYEDRNLRYCSTYDPVGAAFTIKGVDSEKLKEHTTSPSRTKNRTEISNIQKGSLCLLFLFSFDFLVYLVCASCFWSS
ncbi:hypothetical protein DL95DRAFT_416786 [Leptodontidium sp. 2 PMI_412]|nr:hypothetical protein DL95DRAFT_416786 [Leptodontidium sp. 2 PMI_412]